MGFYEVGFGLSCGGRNRTCEVTLNRRPPVPAQAPPQCSRRSRIRTDALLLPKQADFQTFLYAVDKKHPAGVEPALPPWQGSRLPLHHGCVWLNKLSKIRRAGVHRRDFHSVGSEGLEPSPIWLRARHAAASTLIPYCFVFSRRGGNRTLDLVLIRDLLSPLSYAPWVARNA